MIAIAVLLVIGVSIGATLLFTRDGGNDPSNPPTSGTPADIASANDTGPVSIITEEPTCKAFNTINNGLASIVGNGWGDVRDKLGPISQWTSEQRNQVEAVASAMQNAADQVVPLARQTPNRVVREIYEQFIAYGRAYADSVANYVPADNQLASANVSASGAIIGICNSIELESAGRSLALAPTEPPTSTVAPSDPQDAERFITAPSTMCTEWVDRLDQFIADTPDWQTRDGSVPASDWTPERRAVEQAATPLLTAYADQIAAVGRASDNATLEDLSVAASLYLHAYIAAGDGYTKADSWLAYTGFRIANLVSAACTSVAG
ncbi:hypothetical protein [Mycolicibacterium sp. YH-1]|uniref:hypothetical protein n=1 Tax=Mycolicibacterium sp. YH-1 TaxID=2908837 RepID=UPI001F4C44DD|nr:hypothetical protein [Mycolicibacterium sp. YH-1]UNB52756.1 hypothetical protein L0M16_33835 [Mycolicibacterium sp. YH-1]